MPLPVKQRHGLARSKKPIGVVPCWSANNPPPLPDHTSRNPALRRPGGDHHILGSRRPYTAAIDAVFLGQCASARRNHVIDVTRHQITYGGPRQVMFRWPSGRPGGPPGSIARRSKPLATLMRRISDRRAAPQQRRSPSDTPAARKPGNAGADPATTPDSGSSLLVQPARGLGPHLQPPQGINGKRQNQQAALVSWRISIASQFSFSVSL